MSFIIKEVLPSYKGHILVSAECHCGVIKILRKSTINYGKVKSCGCARVNENKRRVGDLHLFNKKHGHRGKFKTTRTYNTWHSMFNRCFNSKNSGYKYYGAKGVTICPRWLDFKNFLLDMGERPDGMTIDRINPFGNYEPNNCRWATVAQQNRNKRRHFEVRPEGQKGIAVEFI